MREKYKNAVYKCVECNWSGSLWDCKINLDMRLGKRLRCPICHADIELNKEMQNERLTY